MTIMLVSLILGAFAALYYYLTQNYKYWQKRGIPCADGALPGVGHMLPAICFRTSFPELFNKIYNDNKNRSMVGFYNFTSPSLLVIEPQLVKTVLQTNFASFNKPIFPIDPDLDPLTALNPFALTGDKWLAARKRLTYAFSSMRLKILLESVKPVCVLFENYLNNKLSKTEKIEVELKDLFSKFTAQVVAGAGFGVDGYCFNEEKENLSFQKIGAVILEPNLRTKIATMLIFLVPSLNKIFKISFVPKHVDNFFRTLVAELMEQRRKDAIPRNDFLHLMTELEKQDGIKFDVELLTAQALSFVLDGYETSSTVMSLVGYQLAVHQEIQKKLREEVMSVFKKYDGEITYEGLKEMTYMDQVLNESQRIIPTIGFQGRICTEEFELRGSDGLICRVQPNTEIRISIDGLHHDSRYWNNPEIFDPERFNSENKQNIDRFAFLPFGEGPRICPGMRMALLQIKAGLATLLRKYSLELSPKTKLPLQMTPGVILASPKGGLWVKIRQL
ncbi:cytochrome P450 6j1-like [Linepithema humile]|uniref:cytochrome P450 6j1-like n=1 Tax=Linepithema humile TaxID=83485 RepID=UPI000623731E|nr:PREDICTED: cytochrome P450 6j1-like [Linepithema humile]